MKPLFCKICEQKMIDPDGSIKVPNEWVFAFVTHNHKKAFICRACFETITEGYEYVEE